MKNIRRIAPRIIRLTLPVLASVCAASAMAQQLDARFSCSAERNQDGEPVVYADSGTFRLNGNRIDAFKWESALFNPPRSADCSIDEDDGLQAEARENAWRITLQDAHAARIKRGYKFGSRINCSIRLERDGDALHVKPTCPALCGSRANFSELSVDLKTGACRYAD
ncbi:MAG: hypothetical protein JWQ21_1168 [Herminiimonas sp.]|nr:hypothetical protein [Herminiimonas sp.]